MDVKHGHPKIVTMLADVRMACQCSYGCNWWRAGLPLEQNYASKTYIFIHLLSFFSLSQENLCVVDSYYPLTSLTAQPIHGRLPLSSVFQQHFKAASLSPLWEGAFTVRSKTERSPEPETQSQVSAFCRHTGDNPATQRAAEWRLIPADQRQHARSQALVHADADGQSAAAQSRRAA